MMNCPKCNRLMVEGSVAIESSALKFFLAGLSANDLVFRNRRDNSTTHLLPSKPLLFATKEHVKSALLCEGCHGLFVMG